MYFVNDEYFEFSTGGLVATGFYDLPYIVDTGITGGVYFYHVHLVILGKSQAVFAFAAWLRIALLAAKGLGQYSRDGGLANSSGAGKKHGGSQTILLHSPRNDFYGNILPNDVGKFPGSVLGG
jgi:hypothetical protein